MLSVTPLLPSLVVEESFVRSKTNDPSGGGDRLVLGPRFMGVIDAATDKSEHRWCFDGNTTTGEQVIASVLARTLEHARCDIWSALRAAQDEVRRIARASSINIHEPGATPLAAFAVLDTQAGIIYRSSDCSIGTVADGVFTPNYNEKRVDRLAAAKRAEVVRAAQAAGVGLVNTDLGRAAIAEELKQSATLANKNPLEFSSTDTLYGVPKSDLVYYQFDATSPPVLEAVSVPHNVELVILTSDGYPRIFPTLEETEAYLSASLKEDPLRIGAHPATKGVASGAYSFDDRSYMRVRLRA